MKQTGLSTLAASINLGMIIFYLSAHAAYSDDPKYVACAPKNCGNQSIGFPFRITDRQEPYCGFPGFDLICHNDAPILNISENYYFVQQIFYNNRSIRVANAAAFDKEVTEGGCWPEIRNLSLTEHKFELPGTVSMLLLFSNCSTWPDGLERYKIGFCGARNIEDFEGLAMLDGNGDWGDAMGACGTEVVVPVELDRGGGIEYGNNLLGVMKKGFLLTWKATDCSECEKSGGRCGFDSSSLFFQCFCPDRPHRVSCKPGRTRWRLILAIVLPGGFVLVTFMLIIWQRKKLKKLSSYLSSLRNSSSDPSSKGDLEGATDYFGLSVFTYEELKEATKNFDPSKELGDGGFGTVYHGKLSDGREVAVKRLYEHNCKRVTQFMNEVQILTRLRHHNLVTLYGCTSRQSLELLLAYEYIPNGTVADHLHGDRAGEALLTWPIRMNVAIETAAALAYLHYNDIIHRDVKTTNILLDSSFSVKVADFGLSRPFPNNVTHVSTAPQGTPGYVDPEYYQCYQLTEKSDVYSFGVVLIELITSMPAVDISRHRHEINLANLAVNRIQNCAFDELIDPSLGYKTDPVVERMTTSVAELAFQCLQGEKDMRPTMDEVVENLKEIRDYRDNKAGEGDKKKTLPPPSPEGDEVVLLKSCKAPQVMSPDTVTTKWVSGSSTSNSS